MTQCFRAYPVRHAQGNKVKQFAHCTEHFQFLHSGSAKRVQLKAEDVITIVHSDLWRGYCGEAAE
jgi:hypothetical protein